MHNTSKHPSRLVETFRSASLTRTTAQNSPCKQTAQGYAVEFESFSGPTLEILFGPPLNDVTNFIAAKTEKGSMYISTTYVAIPQIVNDSAARMPLTLTRIRSKRVEMLRGSWVNFATL